MTARYIIGDVFDVLATLEPDSVDVVFSSPPFLALRSYLPADHPDKGKEIGSEATPADFLDTLLDVVEACDRVLAPHGSLCFELGDTFSGSGGGGGDYLPGGMREGQPGFGGTAERQREGNAAHWRSKGNVGHEGGEGWPLGKSLCLIPTLFAASLAYGYNMLRPERKTPRWRIRNLVVWARPNPPVGALGDKFRPATSYLTVATKSRSRYFDLDAVREPHRPRGGDVTVSESSKAGRDEALRSSKETGRAKFERITEHPAGAPPLDYWVIPTAPYKGAHYATFPPALVVKSVKAMSPARVCRVCGEPSRRITQTTYVDAPGGSALAANNNGKKREGSDVGALPMRANASVETLGWTDDCRCTCDTCAERVGAEVFATCDHKWRAGHVLDPFAGSGTVGLVATGHGRDATLIDLDERNAVLALDRVGPMFLTVEHLSAEGAA